MAAKKTAKLEKALACKVVRHPEEFLKELLDLRNEHPEREKEIDKKIRGTFECERTVFVLDMSGFSRTVIKHGIIHYLAMVRRMVNVVLPAIHDNRGELVKQEADNAFAVFAAPDDAVHASQDIIRGLQALNTVLPDEKDIFVSIGIGHGDILLIPGVDYFGNELNLASKLGEDIAERGEILLTGAAQAKITDQSLNFQKISAAISGVTMKYYKLVSRE
ncbi:adenylate/guanylate cyclase domain-containing protein [Patescibacteria group bacterium]|nr:MAG: adenylate/guanylate cyclase domain-containing protein [Patescibacteria group bacterium]